MKKIFYIVIAIALATSPLISPPPVRAADVSTADLVGEWTAKIEINNLEIIGSPNMSKEDINNLAGQTQKLVFTQSGGSLYLDLPLPAVSQIKLTPNGDQLDGTYLKKIGKDMYDLYVNGKVSKKGGEASFSLKVGGSIVNENQKDIIVFFYIYTSKEKAAAAATTTPQTTTVEEPLEFGTGIEKGRISFVEGRAHIQRGNRIIPAVVGEGLLAGDTVVSESGMVTIEGEASGSLKIPAGIRLQIPEEKAVKKTSSSSLSKMIGNIWTKTKEFLTGESFEVKVCTATCGVRG